MRRTVLKASRAREVRVETDADGRVRVVKRFASPGRISALFDRRRAERELELLTLLHAAGVPVPRPLGLARRAGGFEVATEHLADRRDLAGLLAEGRVPPPAAFRELGRALARLAELWIDHPDLHPGNVLVGARGEIALIDFHAARRRRGPSRARLVRDVVSLEAALRERTPVAARRALLESWLGREPLAPAELDRAARARRIEVVARRARRWLRGGNAVAELVHAGRRAVVRRDLPADARAQLFEAVARASEGVERAAKRVGLASNHPAPRAERLQLATERPTLDAASLELGGRRFVVVRGRAKELESAWLAAARLDEHALAVARPALWLAGRAGAAAFELPRDARPFADAPAAARRRALAEWLGAAWDRGLWLPEIARHACWLDGDGRAWLVAPPTPRPTRRGELARSALAHGGLDVSRAELERAFVASNRGHDLASVERELARA